MSGAVQLIIFGDRSLEVVLPDTCEETLRRHAREIAAASAAIISGAARTVANDPDSVSPDLCCAMLLGAEFLANTAILLHNQADRVGGLS